MLQNRLPEQSSHIIIYFTAKWCGPCNSLPLDRIVAQHKHVVWYICDVDEETYVPGYCGVKSIPSFLGIVHGKATPMHSGSETVGIAKWMLQHMTLPRKT
jgi:thioredoxin-like negative regulator of GroEL